MIIILFFEFSQKNMTICNIFNFFIKKYILFEIKQEGLKMKIVVKSAKNLLEKFENYLDRVAEILF